MTELNRLASFTSLAFLLVSSSCGLFQPTEPLQQAIPSLASAACLQGRLLGAAVRVDPLRSKYVYRRLVVEQLSSITAENAMKLSVIARSPTEFDYSAADMLWRFAQAEEKQLRGHPLVWHRQLPRWMKDYPWKEGEMRRFLQAHLQGLVGRYRGTIYAWDVVNEAVGQDGRLRQSPWFRQMGEGYIAAAFVWAAEADPSATLFYNDYDIGLPGVKQDAVVAFLSRLLEQGVPIHGVGMQLHLRPGRRPTAEQLRRAIKRFADLGLVVHLTEIDDALPLPVDAADLEEQAVRIRSLLQVCVENPVCESITFWGVSDAESWIPQHFQGLGAGLLFDRQYQPKPAYWAVLAELQSGSQLRTIDSISEKSSGLAASRLLRSSCSGRP